MRNWGGIGPDSARQEPCSRLLTWSLKVGGFGGFFGDQCGAKYTGVVG